VKQAGTLDLAVLGLLKDRAMHGYELRKQLGAMLGPLWQVSWGSLYPTLRRLARAGAVEIDQARSRTTRSSKQSLGGRRRTVYRITPEGERMFSRLLEEEDVPVVDSERFSLELAFFRYLRPETRVTVLERRRAHLQEKLAQFRANLRNYRERMDGYALLLQRHDMAATESDIAWIDELITREMAPAAPGAAPSRSGNNVSRTKQESKVSGGLDA
jgi:DNA-binding PadR family transcriptional regulator